MTLWCLRPNGLISALALFAGVSTSASAQNDRPAPTGSGMTGVWRLAAPISALRTSDGKEPPLSAAGAKLYRDHLASRRRGDTAFDSATWCASVGMPRIMTINYPFEIMVRPQYVAFLHEWNWWARIVYLKGALSDNPAAGMGPPPGMAPPQGMGSPPGMGPPPGAGAGPSSGLPGPGAGGPPGAPPGPGPGPGAGPPGGMPPMQMLATSTSGPMGLSKGRWEGDTLVVETTGLDETKLLDNSGLPASENLKVTERLRLKDSDTLEDRLRIEDPAMFARPWETVLTYRRQRGAAIQEDVCLDRIKSGAAAVRE